MLETPYIDIETSNRLSIEMVTSIYIDYIDN